LIFYCCSYNDMNIASPVLFLLITTHFVKKMRLFVFV
jgi:hypothetical protein